MSPPQRHLVLLRHAKSAWPEGVPDRKRPLNDRGRLNAVAAGRWLRDNIETLDVTACSPAERTRQTWALVSGELKNPPAATIDDRIYGAGPDELLAVIHDLPDAADTALLIGHNPGMEELVELLSGQEATMKTAAIAVLTWTGAWADAAPGAAQLQAHATPRGEP